MEKVEITPKLAATLAAWTPDQRRRFNDWRFRAMINPQVTSTHLIFKTVAEAQDTLSFILSDDELIPTLAKSVHGRKRGKKTTTTPGVTKMGHKYQASITYKNVQKYLGMHESPTAALQAIQLYKEKFDAA